MSAERLAVGDLVCCPRCRKWHPAATWDSNSATGYAEKMLFIRCGTARFFVGTIDGRPGDPKAVTSPLIGTASVTTAAKQVALTRLNVLVIGPVAQTEATVSGILVALEKPAYFWAPNVPLPARPDGRPIVIRDFASLSPTLQLAWLTWLTAQQRHRPQIIATSSIPVFPLVTQGMFLADLYYRLNTILLDLRPIADQD